MVNKILHKMKEIEREAENELGEEGSKQELMPFTSMLTPVMQMFKRDKRFVDIEEEQFNIYNKKPNVLDNKVRKMWYEQKKKVIDKVYATKTHKPVTN